MKNENHTLKFFVYGTLKSGEGNHRVAGTPDKIEEAFVVGNLRVAGIPFVEIPENNRLNLGTTSVEKDSSLLKKAGKLKGTDHFFEMAEYSIVSGQIFTYTGTEEYLKGVTDRLDSLEGYNPNGKNRMGYSRVVTLTTDGTPVFIYNSLGYGQEPVGKPMEIVTF